MSVPRTNPWVAWASSRARGPRPDGGPAVPSPASEAYATTVGSVMTRPVVSVRESASYSEVLRVVTAHPRGAGPVVAHRHLVLGVVSESDLLAKLAEQHAPDQPQPSRRQTGAHTRRKASAESAATLMTSPATTIAADASLVDAAQLMTRHSLRRLPVVDHGGRLVGIVSRHDLLRTMPREDCAVRDRSSAQSD